MKRENFKGKVFGKLTIFREHKVGKDWWCVARCECGLYNSWPKRFFQRRRPKLECGFCHLQKGTTKISRVYTMPYTHLPEYHTWSVMIQRCTDPNHISYAEYGGRGIKIDPKWLDKTRDGNSPPKGFNWFVFEVGYKPTPWHTLDRADNNGNYEKANTRWATPKEQRANQRPRKDSESTIPTPVASSTDPATGEDTI